MMPNEAISRSATSHSKRLSDIESAARDRFLDVADGTMSEVSDRPGRNRHRRGVGYHVPTPVALVFMFFIGVGAAGATLYWMGAVNTARETSLSAQLFAAQAETVAAKEKLNRIEAERLTAQAEELSASVATWKSDVRKLILQYADRARALDAAAIAEEPEEAVLTIWLLRQMLAAGGADLDESFEVLQRYEQSRDSVMQKIIELTYPELPLKDALRSIERSVPNDEELRRGNPG